MSAVLITIFIAAYRPPGSTSNDGDYNDSFNNCLEILFNTKRCILFFDDINCGLAKQLLRPP